MVRNSLPDVAVKVSPKMNQILLSMVLIISLMGCASAVDIDMQPGEAAAKERFERGFGSPWIGGDSPVFGSSDQRSGEIYIDQGNLSINEEIDPLPSWNEGVAKNAIFSFVENVTNESHPNYVNPADRIATFDNDGTLWCEYPDVVPGIFVLDLVKEMAPEHPEWNYSEPFSSVLSGERSEIDEFSADEVVQIYIATGSNMTSEEYMGLAMDWLDRSIHPRFGLPYTKCVYKPMLELLDYLRAEGFKIYIVTGGDEDFVRAFSDEVYGIPPEQVIGSAFNLQFIVDNGSTYLMRIPEILVWNDGQEKAKEIQQNIGIRPIFAYGNCDGDIPMLQFATGGESQGIGLLNNHDDPIREYAYVDVGGGRLEEGIEMAGEWGWQVVSMKNDWRYMF